MRRGVGPGGPERKEGAAMKIKTILRLVSLALFVAAVVFVLLAMSCPTCGSVFYIGSFRVGVEVWHVFYKCYAAVMALLFVVSFIVPKGKAGH